MIEFGSGQAVLPQRTVIKFRNNDDGNELMVEVHDKFPQMGDVHVEGRRFVEVSVEMFMYFMGLSNYSPVEAGDESGGK